MTAAASNNAPAEPLEDTDDFRRSEQRNGRHQARTFDLLGGHREGQPEFAANRKAFADSPFDIGLGLHVGAALCRLLFGVGQRGGGFPAVTKEPPHDLVRECPLRTAGGLAAQGRLEPPPGELVQAECSPQPFGDAHATIDRGLFPGSFPSAKPCRESTPPRL